MNVSYIVLICLSLGLVTLTVIRLRARLRGPGDRHQSNARKQAPQIDANESLRRMIEDRYGSSWRVVSADNGEVH